MSDEDSDQDIGNQFRGSAGNGSGFRVMEGNEAALESLRDPRNPEKQRSPKSERSQSAMSDPPEDTEKWVEERVTRAEIEMKRQKTEVEKIAGRVEHKIDNLSSQVDTKITSLDDKIDTTRNWVIGVGTTILLAVISLFLYALNQTNRVEDRVFENTQRIEQVAPQSKPGTNSVQDSNQGS